MKEVGDIKEAAEDINELKNKLSEVRLKLMVTEEWHPRNT